MASIAKRPDGKWRARYRDSAGKEHSKHFPRKVDAQKWLDSVTASVVRGDYVHPSDARTLFKDYAVSWQANQPHLRAGSARILDNALRVHILPVFGSRRLNDIRRSDVQAFVTSLSKTHKPNTVQSIYQVLRRLLEDAVYDRVLVTNPCQRIQTPREAASEQTPFLPTLSAVVAASEALGPHLAPLVTLLAGTGLRIGEALALQPADIDFPAQVIHVTKQRLRDNSIGPTKSGKSRDVPMANTVAKVLLAMPSFGQHEFIFTDELGEPLTYRAWSYAWRRAGAPFKTHDLRHFTASALIAGGASVKQVQETLGHASAVITLRTYAHLWPGDDDRVRNVMDAALNPAADYLRTADRSEQ